MTDRETSMRTVSFEDLPALSGQEIGVSDWVLIDQDRINAFADLTGDRQWIHVDVERARKEAPDGKTIAHGYLVLSLLSALSSNVMRVTGISRGLNYGVNRARFTETIPAGSRLRVRQTLLSVQKLASAKSATDGWLLVSRMAIEVEGRDRPACIAETLTLLYK
jgi:acyl dehydratase